MAYLSLLEEVIEMLLKVFKLFLVTYCSAKGCKKMACTFFSGYYSVSFTTIAFLFGKKIIVLKVPPSINTAFILPVYSFINRWWLIYRTPTPTFGEGRYGFYKERLYLFKIIIIQPLNLISCLYRNPKIIINHQLC